MKIPLLFPQTPPIGFTGNHFRFLTECLAARDPVLQKELVTRLGINKTTLSEIKHDLMRLGWCTDFNLGSGKEISVKICRKNEIERFLGQWEYLGHCVFVRPHDIHARCLFLEPPRDIRPVIEALSCKNKVVITQMNNNTQYIIELDSGKVILNATGNAIQFWINGFILPIQVEDTQNLGEYIYSSVLERLSGMHSFVKAHFARNRIYVKDVVVLKSLSVGIITKENTSNALRLTDRLVGLGLFKDKSIYGCHEFEQKGRFDQVIGRIKNGANALFEMQGEQGGTIDGPH